MVYQRWKRGLFQVGFMGFILKFSVVKQVPDALNICQ